LGNDKNIVFTGQTKVQRLRPRLTTNSTIEVKSLKCGLCGKEVKEQPKITADGKCSVCGAKLKPE
jgi:hypothetical protein